jgi:hypothetical protein
MTFEREGKLAARCLNVVIRSIIASETVVAYQDVMSSRLSFWPAISQAS